MRTDPVPATEALDRFAARWVASGEVTAAFAAIATAEATLWTSGAARGPDRAPDATALFDAASLTKPWVATLALRLDALGLLALGTPLAEVWPACAPSLGRKTLEDLLRHRAGFVPWTPLYRRCRSKAAAERLLISGALTRGDPDRAAASGGGRARGAGGASGGPGEADYSDLDYVLWGLAAERRLGAELAQLLRRFVVGPLGIRGVAVTPGKRIGVVACHCDNAQEVALATRQGLRVARRDPPDPGQPQDGNARFLGGLGGHAGLFVSADALLALGRAWLAALRGEGGFLEPEAARAALGGEGAYALGWARRRVSGSAGRALSAGAFGHVGFTGTSLWLDPPRSGLFVLLGHRCVASGGLNPARRRFHRLALDYLARVRAPPRGDSAQC